MESTKIIEVNGVKMEVDFRTAKTTEIETYKIGDKVKILKKEYSDQYKSYAGIIIGFDNFSTTPTIVVAYLKADYSNASIEMAYLNSKSGDDVQICKANNHDVPFHRDDIIAKFDREIEAKRNQMLELEQKRNYFLNMFGVYFSDAAPKEA